MFCAPSRRRPTRVPVLKRASSRFPELFRGGLATSLSIRTHVHIIQRAVAISISSETIQQPIAIRDDRTLARPHDAVGRTLLLRALGRRYRGKILLPADAGSQRTICEFDLPELESVELPRGLGRGS